VGVKLLFSLRIDSIVLSFIKNISIKNYF